MTFANFHEIFKLNISKFPYDVIHYPATLHALLESFIVHYEWTVVYYNRTIGPAYNEPERSHTYRHVLCVLVSVQATAE